MNNNGIQPVTDNVAGANTGTGNADTHHNNIVVPYNDADAGLTVDKAKLVIDRTVSISVDSTEESQDLEVFVTPVEEPDLCSDGGGGKGQKAGGDRLFCLPAWLRFYVCRALLWLAFLTGVAMLIFFIGSEIQNAAAVRAGGTTHLYQVPNVCGIEGVFASAPGGVALPTFLVSDPVTIRTFDSVETLQATPNSTVAHCGSCGQCSNPHDVKIYDDTRSTLFGSSYACARKSVLGGESATRSCLEEKVGFTEGCNDCWVENIMCTLRSCAFTCLWYSMFNDVKPGSNETRHELNPCTRCDEQMCGPQFVKCAGANRRQTGILSEFSRDNENEVCKKVEHEWWKDEGIHEQWEKQQQQTQEQESPANRRLSSHGNLRRLD